MATPNFAKKNPFMGMTVKQMKDHYDKNVRGKKLSTAQLKNMADQMQAAKKAAPKAKPAASKPRQTTKEQAKSRFYQSSSGTRGQYRKKGDPGPAVRRRGSVRDGESIDPRERSLRRNQNEARRHSRRNLRVNRRGRRI